MQHSQLLTAIDIGTSKVSSILVRRNGPGDVQFLAHSTVPNRGMRKGNVTDAEATEEAVRESIENIQYASGERVVSAYVGVTGGHIEFENRWRPMPWIGDHRVVTAGDMSRVQAEVAAAGVDESRTLVHAIPREYAVDGYAGIRNPEGMHSKDVRVETHVVTASADAAGNHCSIGRAGGGQGCRPGAPAPRQQRGPPDLGRARRGRRNRRRGRRHDRHYRFQKRCRHLHRGHTGRRVPVHQRHVHHL